MPQDNVMPMAQGGQKAKMSSLTLPIQAQQQMAAQGTEDASAVPNGQALEEGQQGQGGQEGQGGQGLPGGMDEEAFMAALEDPQVREEAAAMLAQQGIEPPESADANAGPIQQQGQAPQAQLNPEIEQQAMQQLLASRQGTNREG